MPQAGQLMIPADKGLAKFNDFGVCVIPWKIHLKLHPKYFSYVWEMQTNDRRKTERCQAFLIRKCWTIMLNKRIIVLHPRIILFA